MAETEWKFGKSSLLCTGCQAQLGASDEPYFSALLQGAEGLLRQDFCTGCFQSKRPAEVYYFWKAAKPVADAAAGKRRAVRFDIECVLDFFKRLEGDEASQKTAFRFILALMLTRKKVLIFEQKKKDAAGRDVQIFREKRGGLTHQVIEPSLNEAEIAEVSAELGVLLGLTPPPQPQVQPVPAESPAPVVAPAAAAADAQPETPPDAPVAGV